MAIKGRIFAFHNPKTKQLEMLTDNRGDSPGQLTHNIFPDKKSATSSGVHDDMAYGHGDPIPRGTDDKPGTVVRRFPMGGSYNGHKIKPGSWFRVGVRDRAWTIFQIPEPGEVVEIPFETMKPGNRWGKNQGWKPVKCQDNMDVAANANLAEVFATLNAGPIRMVHGQFEINPVAAKNDPNRLAGWEVWLKNTARAAATRGRTTGYIGTVVLTNEEGEGTKNAGLGLESMVVPDAGYSIMQYIEAGGDYGVSQHGVRATPGTKVRLGIRGHSATETRLPTLAEGTVKLDIKDFAEVKGDASSDWFDTKELTQKMGEKKGLVEIYRKNKRINDEIPDTIYEGEEALIRAEFKQPPQLTARWIEPNEDLSEGGWEIKVRSELPAKDKLGPVGFNAQLKLTTDARAYADAAVLPPVEINDEKREHTWILPYEAKVAGFELKKGQTFRLDTGGLGWRGSFPLPQKGREVDTHTSEAKMLESWVLCESDYKRAKVYPQPILRGRAAEKAAQYPSPDLKVSAVPHSKETPGGGWLVTLTSTLKGDDKGFVANLRFGHHGADPTQLPPKKLTSAGQKNVWFIPKDIRVGPYVADVGQQLVVETGGLGWTAQIELPKKGIIDAKKADAWTFNENDFAPADLSKDSVERTRLGPDLAA